MSSPKYNSIRFTGLRPETERGAYSREFSKYGQITKLYIHPEFQFGVVNYTYPEDVVKAIRNGNNVPPLFLTLQVNNKPRNQQQNGRASASSSEHSGGKSKNNHKEIMYDYVHAEVGSHKVDIHGNIVNIIEDDSGNIFVPLVQVEAAGFHIFNREDFGKKHNTTNDVLNEFQLYMKAKARKFATKYCRKISEKDINDSISKCQTELFSNNADFKTFNGDDQPMRRPREPLQPYENGRRPTAPARHGGEKLATVSLTLNQLQEVIVTHVDDKTSYWVRLASESDNFDQIQSDCSRSEAAAKTLSAIPGHIYMAKINGEWSRVQAGKQPSEVFFIDIGVKAERKAVKSLYRDLITKPAQAVKIVFTSGLNAPLEVGDRIMIKPLMPQADGCYYVETPKSDFRESPPKADARSKTFGGSASNAKLKALVNGATSQRDELKLREPNIEQPVAAKVTNESVSVEPVKQPKKEEPVCLEIKCLTDKIGATGIFCCNQVINADTFVAYFLCTDFEAEILLLEEISEECKPDSSFKPKVGDLVAVERTEEEDETKWVRAVVTDVRDGKYVCALIDYGTSLETEVVRKLPEKFAEILWMSCVCRADSAASLKIIEEGKDNVEFLVQSDKTLKLTIEDRSFVVTAEIWDPLKEKVYDQLPPIYELNDGDFVKIISTEANCMLVRTKKCYETLKEIVAEIDNLKATELKSSPTVGQLVLSPCTGLDGVYRAVIKEINDKAVVYFMDYGNTDEVAIKDLRNVNEKLATTHCACMKTVRLKNSKDEEFGPKPLAFLSDNSNKPCNVVFSKDKSEVDFKFSDCLLSEVFASFEKKAEKPAEDDPPSTLNAPSTSRAGCSSETPRNASTECLSDGPVKYTDLPRLEVNPGEYHCMCIDTTNLEEASAVFMMTDEDTRSAIASITDEIEECTEFERYAPATLDMCVAKYEGQWFRAVILDRVGERDAYNVYFIDFGNTEVVSVEDIGKMPPSLSKTSPLGMMCTLNGLLKDGEERVGKRLLEKLKTLVENDEVYTVKVEGVEDAGNFLIEIPDVYEKLRDEGLI